MLGIEPEFDELRKTLEDALPDWPLSGMRPGKPALAIVHGRRRNPVAIQAWGLTDAQQKRVLEVATTYFEGRRLNQATVAFYAPMRVEVSDTGGRSRLPSDLLSTHKLNW